MHFVLLLDFLDDTSAVLLLPHHFLPIGTDWMEPGGGEAGSRSRIFVLIFGHIDVF